MNNLSLKYPSDFISLPMDNVLGLDFYCDEQVFDIIENALSETVVEKAAAFIGVDKSRLSFRVVLPDGVDTEDNQVTFYEIKVEIGCFSERLKVNHTCLVTIIDVFGTCTTEMSVFADEFNELHKIATVNFKMLPNILGNS